MGVMKQQSRREILRAVLPALAGAAVMAVLWCAEDWAYEAFCAGLPDSGGGLQIGMVPGFFLEDADTAWMMLTDWHMLVPWALACAFFALPPLVAFLYSRGKAAHIFSLALLLGAITHGCVNVVSFYAPPSLMIDHATLVGLPVDAWAGVAWILSLSLGGAAVGIGVQRIARAVARRADRRKTLARE
jgi:hypothetical protein